MRSTKKLVAIVLICALLLSLVSCGEFRPATGSGNNNGGTGGSNSGGSKPDGSVDQPGLDGDPTNDFTVQLRLNEQPFRPTTAMNVYWSDGYNATRRTQAGIRSPQPPSQ